MKDSSFGRVLSVLFTPGETFESIGERPTWVVPLLVLLLLGGAVGFLVQVKTDPEEAVRAQMSKMKVEVPPEQVDKMIRDAENRTTGKKLALTAVGVVVSTAVYFLVAFLFWASFRLFGSEIDYLRSLAVTVHGYMPLAVAALLNLPLMLARDTISFEEATSGGVLLSSLAALAPEDASSVLKAFLNSLDLFSIWAMVLLALGYRIVARVSTAVSAGIVVLLWLIYVGGKLGLVSLFVR